MTIEERIQFKRERIEQLRAQIARAQERIGQLQKEIDLLEATEMKGFLKSLNMPFDEVKELLKELRPAETQPETEGGDAV